jgi:hypothetical protein
VARRTRWEAGEYDAPVTPERLVLRQKVVGRTAVIRTDVREHIKDSQRGGGGRLSSRVCVDVLGNVETRRGGGLTHSEKETLVGGVDCGRCEETLDWVLCALDVRFGGESKASSNVRTSTGEEGAVEGSAVSRVTITDDLSSGWLRRAKLRLNPSGFGWNGVGETSTVRSAIDLVRIETSDERSVGVSGRCQPEVFEDSAASRQIRKVL